MDLLEANRWYGEVAAQSRAFVKTRDELVRLAQKQPPNLSPDWQPLPPDSLSGETAALIGLRGNVQVDIHSAHRALSADKETLAALEAACLPEIGALVEHWRAEVSRDERNLKTREDDLKSINTELSKRERYEADRAELITRLPDLEARIAELEKKGEQ